MKALIRMPSVTKVSVADGQRRNLLERLEAENKELRENVVALLLNIQELHQALHNGQSDKRLITFSVTGTPDCWSGWPKLP